ncbi:hypothetical protein DYBT9275_03480 [Dyadobacter sp. CECT 9275]|uniref:histidine kinase n=1 Tax=Dyadobacter helix TaxID=2822344 RepID=A0A916JG93_9BACT|nr:sensor histidine kinase [Dyadobacter sp. CECT 9275]CAG5004941.1 hypothetical protein DYBT9275_03480 [Dyadobacter sp. CECT 9275]
MKNFRNKKFQGLLLLQLLLLGIFSAFAQKRDLLPLQSHKILYADTVYRQAIKTQDSLLLAESYYLYGKVYEATGDDLTACRWYMKSMRIQERCGDAFHLCRIYSKLAGFGLRAQNYSETRRYAFLTLKYAEADQSYLSLSRAYGLMTNFYSHDWSENGRKPGLPSVQKDSLGYFLKKNEKLILQSPENNPVEIATRKSNLGNLLIHYRYDDRGIKLRKDALEIFLREKEVTEAYQLMVDFGFYYLNKNRETALKYVKDAEELKKNNLFNSLWDEKLLAEFYEKYYRQKQDWKSAYEYNNRYHQLDKVNYLADRDGAITRLSKEYETEQKDVLLKVKDAELKLRTQTLQNQEYWTYAILCLLIATFGASIVFFRLYKKNRGLRIKNEELMMEQSHRVRNNLQAVSSMLSLQSDILPDETTKRIIEDGRLRIEAMGLLNRKLAEVDNGREIFLPDFITELMEGVLQSYGYENIITNIAIDPVQIPANQALHLGLILNELVTNACKYAFPRNTCPEIRMVCKLEKGMIRFVFGDNGGGVSAGHFLLNENPADNRSFGVTLIRLQASQLRARHKFSSGAGLVFEMDFKIGQRQKMRSTEITATHWSLSSILN